VESTIIEVLGGRAVLLRPGGLPVEFVEDELGEPVLTDAGPARASGMLPSHYAPQASVELVAPGVTAAATGEAVAAVVTARLAAGSRVALLAVPDDVLEGLDDRAVRLGPVGDVAGYARVLYRRLRDADEAGVDCIVAVLPPADGLGRAVRDRLQKAAAPRP
jgi:L-threonylcarbamoyladenylate synthase